MSTRCQIKIKNSDNDDNIHIYKHSDGYPEGVLPILIPFVRHFYKNRGSDDAYLLAQINREFAVHDFLDGKLDYCRTDGKLTELMARKCSFSVLGWGLDREEHGDIQYLYEIDSKTADIYVNGEKLTDNQLAEYKDTRDLKFEALKQYIINLSRKADQE